MPTASWVEDYWDVGMALPWWCSVDLDFSHASPLNGETYFLNEKLIFIKLESPLDSEQNISNNHKANLHTLSKISLRLRETLTITYDI